MKKIIIYLLVFLTITIVVISFSTYIYKQKEISKFKTTLKLVVNETKHGWNYEIYKGDIILVKQDIIPSVSGKQYFKTKNDAKKIGLLVLTKLKNNERPIITIKDIEDNKINCKK